NMKQSEFAEKINISRSYLSELENGKKSPTEQVLSSIVKEFDLPKNFFAEEIKIPEITYEMKISEVNKIKFKAIEDMKSLNTYKKEFDSLINIYAELVFQHRRMM